MTSKKLSIMSTLTVALNAASLAMVLLVTLLQKPLGILFKSPKDLPFAFPFVTFYFALLGLIFAIILKVISNKEKPVIGAIVIAAIYVFVNSASHYSYYVESFIVSNTSESNLMSISNLVRYISTLNIFSPVAYALFFVTAGMCLLTSKPAKILATIDLGLFGVSVFVILLITIFQKQIFPLISDYYSYGKTSPFVVSYWAIITALISTGFAAILLTAYKTKKPGQTAAVTAITYLIYASIGLFIASMIISKLAADEIFAISMAKIHLNRAINMLNSVPIIATPLFYFTSGVYLSDNPSK